VPMPAGKFFQFSHICHSTVALHTNISLGGINNRSVSGCCSETVSVNIDKTFLHFKDSQANMFVLNAHPWSKHMILFYIVETVNALELYHPFPNLILYFKSWTRDSIL
jgi:hypothetical protein